MKNSNRYTRSERKIRKIAGNLWDEDYIRSVFRGYPRGQEDAAFGWYVEFIFGEPIFIGYSVSEAEKFLLDRWDKKERTLPSDLIISDQTFRGYFGVQTAVERLQSLGWNVTYGEQESEEWAFTDELQELKFLQELDIALRGR